MPAPGMVTERKLSESWSYDSHKASGSIANQPTTPKFTSNFCNRKWKDLMRAYDGSLEVSVVEKLNVHIKVKKNSLQKL